MSLSRKNLITDDLPGDVEGLHEADGEPGQDSRRRQGGQAGQVRGGDADEAGHGAGVAGQVRINSKHKSS